MSLPFPEPTEPAQSGADVLLGYLDYFRSVLVSKLQGLPSGELRSSRLPSGWTPLALLEHLTFVELRWLVWGFEGEPVAHPWGDAVAGRWVVAAEQTLDALVVAFWAQAARTRAVVQAHQLSDIGRPSERWAGAPPATLERVLLHLLEEYARHVGHLDIVCELIDGQADHEGVSPR